MPAVPTRAETDHHSRAQVDSERRRRRLDHGVRRFRGTPIEASVHDRPTLLRNVWDYGWDGDTRVVDLCVQRLRKKIGAERIETVRGFGYKLVQ